MVLLHMVSKSLIPLVVLLALAQSCYGITITLAWDPSDGATGYKIYSGLESGVYQWSVDVGDVLIYTTSEIIAFGYTYYFAATAYDDTEESDYSNEVSLRIMPDNPSGIKLVAY